MQIDCDETQGIFSMISDLRVIVAFRTLENRISSFSNMMFLTVQKNFLFKKFGKHLMDTGHLKQLFKQENQPNKEVNVLFGIICFAILRKKMFINVFS